MLTEWFTWCGKNTSLIVTSLIFIGFVGMLVLTFLTADFDKDVD